MTSRTRARGDGRRFDVQRMDFLLLLPHSVRVVIEVDGQQHYSTNAGIDARPSPEEYARTARGDRHLRLAGYEVYRFGGYELRDDAMWHAAVDDFFTRLFRRHPLCFHPARTTLRHSGRRLRAKVGRSRYRVGAQPSPGMGAKHTWP